MRYTLILTVVLFAVYWLIAASGPRAVGLWQDDAIYVCTAKSLAAGTGYRHIELPGAPLQTQYPILYPALLALGFLVGGEYPQNLTWLLAPSALAAAGLLALSFRYWRDVLSAGWPLAVLAGILAALSPAVWSFVRFPMSDLPYGVLALAAVYIVDHKYASAPSDVRGRRWLLVAAVLVALSMLTRSIGITLAAALLALLLWQRRWRHAGLVVLVVGVCLAPWYARQFLAARANGALQSAFLIAPNLDYGLWWPGSVADTARVVLQNAFRSAFGLAYFQIAVPQSWVQAALGAASWRTLLLHVLCYALVLLIGLGLVSSLRPRVRLLHVYAAAYVALMLAWPFEPYRFLIPWTPFVLFFLLTGLDTARRWIVRGLSPGLAGRLATVPLGLAVVAAVLAFFLWDNARIVTSTEREYHLRELPIEWTEVRAVEQWVDKNTRPDDVLAAAYAAGLYLATGRQGYYFWPDTDPYRLFYGADRSWTNLYVLPGRSEGRHLTEELRRRLDEVYAAARIRFYIEHRYIDVGEGAMAAYVRSRPEVFQPVFTTHPGNFTVLRVQLPAAHVAGERPLP